MGKLIKNHWARLIILTAAAYQVAASVSGFFWPKLFWDFLTTNLDHAVRPIPILQIINLLLGLLGLCWEWPLPLFTSAATSTRLHHNHTAASYSHTSQRTGHKHTDSNASPPRAPNRATTALAAMHRSIEARLFIYPLSSLAALLLYQGTNAGIYYIIGMAVYFWGFSEGEVVMGVPWTLPRRRKSQGLLGV
ncbi:hypothetical protein HO133_009245 [Letharia lupina]|uniref:DUF7727 domain-containing protein n=1 Tax=Letharia lupina TaxID=560253 RepID=A0A8H6CMQ4_9LECA|nr:uncharacterized protein HO133_009245 [Letharia lupina]KAF6226379.1 hypothetical protein HO133_009245 [Letharia lupina]